jgi:alpha-glucosidase
MTLSSHRYREQRLFTVLLTFSTGLCFATQTLAQDIQIKSPNGQISATVTDKNGIPTYQVSFKGRTVIAPSALGITVDGQNLGQLVSVAPAATSSFRETYPVRGGHTTAVNAYNETIIPLTGGAQKTAWQLEMRAFNDGIAYRYRVPGTGTHKIDGESSQWKLPSDSILWFQTNTREYENPFQEVETSRLTSGQVVGAPVTAKLADGLGYAMLSEANLVKYSDMALKSGDAGTFNAVFDKNPQGWNNDGEIVSPWRITLLANDLNALVNSDIHTNLCPLPAPELANAAWIQPGRSTWHWMVTGRPVLSIQPQWVDWTQQLGFEYYLIDDGWVDWRQDGKDQWACIKSVVDYAKTKNVRIWAWVHSKELRDEASRNAYFQKAKDAGLVGLKIDFPGRPDADWVQWYDDTLRDTAKYQLMIDFHGAVKPSGRERTWPHELTREAIFGRESGKLPAIHDTALPFTRYILGHADFTPTEFRLDRLKGSSWAHELAQSIVYTSPFYCYGGDPADYLTNAASDVLKAIPATWDATLVLPQSEVGRTAAFARRKGNDWFIGIVNGNNPRPFPIDLSFLGAGKYRIDKLADSPDNNATWNRTAATVTSKDKFSVPLRADGGFVARLTKLN